MITSTCTSNLLKLFVGYFTLIMDVWQIETISIAYRKCIMYTYIVVKSISHIIQSTRSRTRTSILELSLKSALILKLFIRLVSSHSASNTKNSTYTSGLCTQVSLNGRSSKAPKKLSSPRPGSEWEKEQLSIKEQTSARWPVALVETTAIRKKVGRPTPRMHASTCRCTTYYLSGRRIAMPREVPISPYSIKSRSLDERKGRVDTDKKQGRKKRGRRKAQVGDESRKEEKGQMMKGRRKEIGEVRSEKNEK